MIKRRFIKITSLILVISMLCTVAAPVFAEEEENDFYIDGVIGKFEDSFVDSPYYTDILSDNFYYEDFADNIEDLNWAKKGIVWMTNSLLQKNLDKDAYVEYLTKLISMMQNDISTVAFSQAEYNQESNLAKDITSLTLNILFTNEKASLLFEKAVKVAECGISLHDEMKSGSEKFMAISYAISNYENQYAILETIKNNTDDKKLKEACEEVQEMYAYQCAYISDKWKRENIQLYNAEVQLVARTLYTIYAQEINAGFFKWVSNRVPAEKLLGTLLKYKKAFSVLQGVFDVAMSVKTGLQIGGGIMNLFVGKRAELFREQLALAEISDALTAGLKKEEDEAWSGSDEKRYEEICEFVTIAGALIYTHTRGEYCFVESMSEDEKYKGDRYYNKTLVPKMTEYSNVIMDILGAPKDLMAKVIESLRGADSMRISQVMKFELTAMGQNVKNNVTMECDMNVAQGVSHYKMSTDSNGRAQGGEFYVSMGNETYDLYVLSNGQWTKQEGIGKDLLYQFSNGFDGVEGIVLFLENLEEVEIDGESDENNYIINAKISSQSINAILESAGMGSIVSSLDSLSLFGGSDILQNLSPMKMELIVNKETYFPSYMAIDMKDTITSLFENMQSMMDEMSQSFGGVSGQKLSYEVVESSTVTEFSEYNTLPEINIPVSQ